MTAHTYSTLTDLINQEIIPALGERVNDFDIDAIASAISEYHEETDEQGNILLNYCGYRMVEDADFWKIVENNAL